jgi:hypothetical protein
MKTQTNMKKKRTHACAAGVSAAAEEPHKAYCSRCFFSSFVFTFGAGPVKHYFVLL